MRYLLGRLANWRKLEHFDEVLEEENADKSIIRLPRHATNQDVKTAYIPHLKHFKATDLHLVCTL